MPQSDSKCIPLSACFLPLHQSAFSGDEVDEKIIRTRVARIAVEEGDSPVAPLLLRRSAKPGMYLDHKMALHVLGESKMDICLEAGRQNLSVIQIVLETN